MLKLISFIYTVTIKAAKEYFHNRNNPDSCKTGLIKGALEDLCVWKKLMMGKNNLNG